MAALTRLDCFIVCPHLCGDCDLIVPPCRCLARRQRPNSAPRERASKIRCKAPNGQRPLCAPQAVICTREIELARIASVPGEAGKVWNGPAATTAAP